MFYTFLYIIKILFLCIKYNLIAKKIWYKHENFINWDRRNKHFIDILEDALNILFNK